eukprot:544583_1
MSKYHNANKDDSKNSDFEATKSTSKNNMNEEPCYVDVWGNMKWAAGCAIYTSYSSVGFTTAKIALAPVAAIGYGSWSMYKNYKEDQKVELTKEYNNKCKLFNDNLSNLKKIERQILDERNKLITQENLINVHEFEIDRYAGNSKVIALIGPTGYGK